jgi:hypothetical protein
MPGNIIGMLSAKIKTKKQKHHRLSSISNYHKG